MTYSSLFEFYPNHVLTLIIRSFGKSFGPCNWFSFLHWLLKMSRIVFRSNVSRHREWPKTQDDTKHDLKQSHCLKHCLIWSYFVVILISIHLLWLQGLIKFRSLQSTALTMLLTSNICTFYYFLLFMVINTCWFHMQLKCTRTDSTRNQHLTNIRQRSHLSK